MNNARCIRQQEPNSGHRSVRPVWTVALGIVLSLGLSGTVLSQNDQATATPDADELIESLAVWSPPPETRDETLFRSAFPTRLSQQHPGTVVAPQVVELVRGGVASMPALLAHLSDDRLSRMALPVPTPGTALSLGSIMEEAEYDPRHRDGATNVVNLDEKPSRGPSAEERRFLYVGDLCYLCIGQIVNRQLWPVRFYPTSNLAINSPVIMPALARATRRDWASLTKTSHIASLEEDAVQYEFSATPEALVRLQYYYPDAAERFIVRLLRRPVYSGDTVRSFVEIELLEHSEKAQQNEAIKNLRATHGEAARDGVPDQLMALYRHTNPGAYREAIDVALKRLCPRGYTEHALRMMAVSDGMELELLRWLEPVHSPAIDSGIASVLEMLYRQVPGPSHWDTTDNIALSCARHLEGEGRERLIRGYFQRRLRMLRGGSPSELADTGPHEMQRWLRNHPQDSHG